MLMLRTGLMLMTGLMQMCTEILTSYIIISSPSKKIFTNPSDSRTEDYVTGRFG